MRSVVPLGVMLRKNPLRAQAREAERPPCRRTAGRRDVGWMGRDHTPPWGRGSVRVPGEGKQCEVSRWVSLLLRLPAAPRRASA